MRNVLLKVVALLVMVALLAVLVPSAVPFAIGETVDEYPVYTPVELEGVFVTPIDYLAETPYAPIEEAFLPDNGGYLDDTLSVRVETMRAYDTTIMLTWVQIADASQMRTELNKPYPSKSTARPDVIAKRVNAVLAISGDNFVDRKVGFIARNGEVLRENYNENCDTLIIDENGDFTILPGASAESVAAFDGTIIQAFSFGPGLVIDGEMITEYTPAINCAPTHETQRIAIAQMGPLSYLIVSTEGPENKGSTGLTLREMAQLMKDLGAQNAYNLDGGSSSAVILHGKKINSLSTGKIRSIGDILYFVTAVSGEESAE